MTAGQIRHARDMLTQPDNTVSSIARLLGVSRATISKYVPEVNRAPEHRPASRTRVVGQGLNGRTLIAADARRLRELP